MTDFFSGDWVSGFFGSLNGTDIAILCVNVLLLIGASWIFRWMERFGEEAAAQSLKYFRSINILCIAVILIYRLFLEESAHNKVIQIVASLLVCYGAVLAYQVAAFFIQARYGNEKETNDGIIRIETYHSRVIKMLAGVFIFILTLIAIIQIFNFSSLLEAGGVLGFLGVMLALTQASWAPDLIGGLIILNSHLVEEGDVIEITDNGRPICCSVFRTKVFHTELLNMVDNHRLMIRNSKLRDLTIHNLSKFASAKGLRENLRFNIGYGTDPDEVHKLFRTAIEKVVSQRGLKIEKQYEAEVRTMDAGDYAVNWAIYYYTKDVKNLYRIRQALREEIIVEAEESGINLATPLLHINASPQNAE